MPGQVFDAKLAFISHVESGHKTHSQQLLRGGATGSKGRKLICTSTANVSFGDDFQQG